jgi:antibiotic biosynthesis monooxygenase (ABM) superfamily enzyme
MKAPAILIGTSKVRTGREDDFASWQVRYHAKVSGFHGFLSSELMPPAKPENNEWTILLKFKTPRLLEDWLRSEERAALVAEALPLMEGDPFGERAQIGSPTSEGESSGSHVTEVILSKIKPGMEEAYRMWAARIQQAQAKADGYLGIYVQPPVAGERPHWTTLLRFDSTDHLDAWLNSDEYLELLREAEAIIEKEQTSRLAASFPGWVPVNPETGESPPNWKTALLVLLGLFPLIMLQQRFLSPHLRGLNSSVAIFLGNISGVTATTYVTMPFLVRRFSWWLFLGKDARRKQWIGSAIIGALLAVEIAACWRLLPN